MRTCTVDDCGQRHCAHGLCNRHYQAARYVSSGPPSRDARYKTGVNARRKAHCERIAALKLAIGCADCGLNDDARKLHFHHLPGEVKLFNIAQTFGRRPESIEAEIAKCEVVCVRCHALRHVS